jgi:hypothetical protein
MRKLTIVSLSLLVLAVSSPVLAKVTVDWDDGVDFSKYKTYGWMEGTPASSSIVQGRINRAIEREIEAKGLAKLEQGKPDLYIVTHASVDNETRVSAHSFGYGGYPRWGGWGGWGSTSVNVSSIPVGTLLVDLVDAETDELVWRSMASATVKSKPAKSEKQINKKVGKMFNQFPPPTQ